MSLTQQGSTFERLQRYSETWLQPQDKIGRPPLANAEIASQIVKYLAQGNYLQPACEAAGTSYKTVREWIRKAAEDRERGETSPYTEFVDVLVRATAASETALVERLNVAEDWRAQAFLLERRHRNRWGKTDSQKQETQQILVVSDALAAGIVEALKVAVASRGELPQSPATEPPALDAEFTQGSEDAEEL